MKTARIGAWVCAGILLLLWSCSESSVPQSQPHTNIQMDSQAVSVLVLGTVQDGGSPHIACKKACCKNLFTHPDPTRRVVSLGLIDGLEKKNYLFEAGPDLPGQLKHLMKVSGNYAQEMPEAIFLSHAHIGHYTGLMYLGKEASNANEVKVYTMPRFQVFLRYNGPWSQLVNKKNISLRSLQNKQELVLRDSLQVIPVLVPHRDEYSETVGFIIQGPHKKLLFIPDIDKWEKWETDIIELVKSVDYALLDGTFYSGDEIKQRDLSAIPHPFVFETMRIFSAETREVKNKIHFIHLNHSNPLLDKSSSAYKQVLDSGFHVAAFGQRFGL